MWITILNGARAEHSNHTDEDSSVTNAQAEDAAFRAGRAARLAGKPAHANPYPPAWSLWVEWDAGWEEADYGLPPDDPRYDGARD